MSSATDSGATSAHVVCVCAPSVSRVEASVSGFVSQTASVAAANFDVAKKRVEDKSAGAGNRCLPNITGHPCGRGNSTTSDA